jgi:predicted metal-dependent phosphoesterase TrpH
MKIDLHIHSKSSDGKMDVQDIFKEAKDRNIDFIAITDHDSIACQAQAIEESKRSGIDYLTGVELNIAFSHPKFLNGKTVSLDLLGYQFDSKNKALSSKLETMANYREERAAKILNNLNAEFRKENIGELTKADLCQIEETVDGSIGRPHIADYLVKKNIVKSRQDAFDKYLVKCDVPKFQLYLEEAAKLIKDAGGKLVIAHPNDPHGTSLSALTNLLTEQTQIIAEKMLTFIDGVECWHSRHTLETTKHYVAFAKEYGLIMTGGSDCHQKPIVMGTVDVPSWVRKQFS